MLSILSRCSVRSCEDIMDQPDVLLGPKLKPGPFPGPPGPPRAPGPGPAPGPLPGPWAMEIFEAKSNAAAAAIRSFIIIISCGSRLLQTTKSRNHSWQRPLSRRGCHNLDPQEKMMMM